jgi:hypothetical protein
MPIELFSDGPNREPGLLQAENLVAFVYSKMLVTHNDSFDLAVEVT